MKSMKVDVAIIGAGTAGITARGKALANGAENVVVIESGPHGTTCARVGCMPSKLLIAAADAAHSTRNSAEFGVRSQEVRIDGAAVMQRVRALRDRFAGGVVDNVESWPEQQRLSGRARFVGPTTLQVDDHTRVEARAVVIATGSSPWLPPPFGDLASELGDRLITTDTLFELEALPESLAVIGAGPIGLELGQAMHRLGVRTTLFEITEHVGVARDPEVRAEVMRVFEAELDLKLNTKVTSAEAEGSGVRLRWEDGSGQTGDGPFERVLVATGRRPNVAELDLQAAGIELDERGMPNFDHRTMQCGDAPVFIAGDVDAQRPVLHEAADEGRHAGTNAALYPDVRAHRRKLPVQIVFTDPQMAVVGEPGGAEGEDVACGQVRFANQGRALVIGQAEGIVRIWGRREDGRLSGAELFGPRVEHLAHLLAWAMQQNMTVDVALTMPFYHPVVEEGLRTALAELASKLKLGAPKRPLDCGPGD